MRGAQLPLHVRELPLGQGLPDRVPHLVGEPADPSPGLLVQAAQGPLHPAERRLPAQGGDLGGPQILQVRGGLDPGQAFGLRCLERPDRLVVRVDVVVTAAAPVHRKANLHAVPADYDRKQTIAGGERFTTPALKEYEARVLGADERILERELEIFERLREQVASEAPRIQDTARALATLDVLAALAETAAVCHFTKPHVHEGDELVACDARHPVVERVTSEVRLDSLPVITSWPEDGGPFITLPLVYTTHPDKPGHNLGMYRLHVGDARSTGMHWQIGKGGGYHYAVAEQRSQSLPATVFLGGPPALILSAVARRRASVRVPVMSITILPSKVVLKAMPVSLTRGSHAKIAL